MKWIFDHTVHIRSQDFWWAILNQVVLSIGAIGIIVILSNVLNAEVFGKARFLTAILAIFAFFSLPGIGPVVLQQMPIYSYKGFRQALITQVKWGLGATVGALSLAIIFVLQHDIDLARAFVICGVLAPVANLYLMPGTALAGLHRYKHKALYDGLIVGIVVLGVWYGSIATGTVTGTMAWYYSTQTVITLLALYFVKGHLTKETVVTYDIVEDTKYGKQITLFQLPFTLVPALEKILIFVFLGPAALAIYIIAFLPIEHIRNAYRHVLQFFILPKLQVSPNDTHDMRQWFLTTAVLSTGGILAIIVFALTLLSILFPQYENVRIFMLLSAIIPLALPSYVYVLKILSERSVERLYSYAIITVLVDILTFTILTSLFGLWGAVFAKIITAFIAAGIAFVLYKSSGSKK